MRAKSDNRLLAEKLRREEGLSYNEIAGLTGISKSTLSHWLRYISLTPEQEERIQKRVQDNRSGFVARAWQINKERFQKAREEAYQIGVESVSRLTADDAIDELALAMLYLGEGDKSGNRVQIASTDPKILRYFIWAMKKLYQVDKKSVSLRVNIIEAARPVETEMIDWWSNQLSCSPSQFQKTQFDRRSTRSVLTGDYHGVCTATYNNTYLYQRLLGVYSTYIRRRLVDRKDHS